MMMRNVLDVAISRRSALIFAMLTVLAPRTRLAAAHLASQGVVRTTASYVIPRITLTDMLDHKIRLDRLLAADKAAIVEFFFTSCTSICGLQASALSTAQAQIAAVGRDCSMLSISIDPEFDTPARLREYAEGFKPAANWYLLTGRQRDIERVMASFDARYPGDNKMLHQPYTFIRLSPAHAWRRVEGMLDGDELVAEYCDVIANSN
jgi:protein SCO1/2